MKGIIIRLFNPKLKFSFLLKCPRRRYFLLNSYSTDWKQHIPYTCVNAKGNGLFT